MKIYEIEVHPDKIPVIWIASETPIRLAKNNVVKYVNEFEGASGVNTPGVDLIVKSH